MCDKVAIMYAGEMVEQGSIEDILTGDVHHPYTLGLLGSILSEETYIDAALLTLDSTLASAGFTNIVLSKGNIAFAGEERSVIALSAEVSGVPVYEILIPFVCDGYICNVTLTTVYTDTCADILPFFYAVDSVG